MHRVYSRIYFNLFFNEFLIQSLALGEGTENAKACDRTHAAPHQASAAQKRKGRSCLNKTADINPRQGLPMLAQALDQP